MKPRKAYGDAHERLKALYDERVPKGMSQEQFGAEYGIGTQGMVWQYLSGYRPLNYDSAAKFARALKCTIYDISPEMAEELKSEILPVLGKWRRAAVIAALALLSPQFFAQPADAAPNSVDGSRVCVLCQIINTLILWLTFRSVSALQPHS